MKKAILLTGMMVLALSLIACSGNTAIETEEETIQNTTESTSVEENVNNTSNTESTESVTTETADEAVSKEVLAVGERIPNFELTTLQGEKVSLHDYEGKIILLNFWTTW